MALTPHPGVRHAAALQSPCFTCPAWCCTRLTLHSFWVRTLVELDHACYLLNFDHIELGLSASGEWSVYYAAPCRLLSADGRCTVHGAPAQPMICASYNEHACWYKRVLPSGTHQDFLRVDRRRMAALVKHMSFDEHGTVLEVPTWEALHELFDGLDVGEGTATSVPPAGDLAVKAPNGPPGRNRRSALEILNSDPCAQCSAYCCTTLVFPLTRPADLAGLDFVRFALGFPAVEVVVGEATWSLAVGTSCRHLDGTRCSVFGELERPFICRHYDARSCSYKAIFGPSGSPNELRLRFEDFDRLLSAVEVEADGAIAALPSPEDLQLLLQ